MLREESATFGGLGAHPQHLMVVLSRELREVCASSRFRTVFEATESLNPPKNLSKELAGDGDLGHLERDVMAMADYLATNLDQFVSQAGQRPMPHGVGQRQGT